MCCSSTNCLLPTRSVWRRNSRIYRSSTKWIARKNAGITTAPSLLSNWIQTITNIVSRIWFNRRNLKIPSKVSCHHWQVSIIWHVCKCVVSSVQHNFPRFFIFSSPYLYKQIYSARIALSFIFAERKSRKTLNTQPFRK